jgi:hypothetical protein
VTETNKTFTSLASTFDVEDVVDTSRRPTEIVEITEQPMESSVEADADAVRDTLYKLLKHGEDAFEDLKRIAVAEESPRSFEVLNGMLGNLSDIAIKLLDVHERKAKIQKSVALNQNDQQPINNGVVNNNTVFVGTTTDLQTMLSNLNLK